MGLLDVYKANGAILSWSESDKAYTGNEHAGDSGFDETGFGMEEEYNFFFFDEYFRLLQALYGWSHHDMRVNEKRLRKEREEKRKEYASEREAFMKAHGNEGSQWRKPLFHACEKVCWRYSAMIKTTVLPTNWRTISLPSGLVAVLDKWQRIANNERKPSNICLFEGHGHTIFCFGGQYYSITADTIGVDNDLWERLLQGSYITGKYGLSLIDDLKKAGCSSVSTYSALD